MRLKISKSYFWKIGFRSHSHWKTHTVSKAPAKISSSNSKVKKFRPTPEVTAAASMVILESPDWFFPDFLGCHGWGGGGGVPNSSYIVGENRWGMDCFTYIHHIICEILNYPERDDILRLFTKLRVSSKLGSWPSGHFFNL